MSEDVGRGHGAIPRREAIKLIVASGAATVIACSDSSAARGGGAERPAATEPAVRSVEVLGSPWQTSDPFLFCVHHDDRYPAGNERLGPEASLAGRKLGYDFAGIDGWRMYHGHVVPGFPRHPHRGFETVTVVRTGLLDHSDSLGAAARYGSGDTQWLTAGAGIQHAEMFPLLDRGTANPIDFFQIWLNLPAADKMVAPHFSMLWAPAIPQRTVPDSSGKRVELTLIAGRYGELVPPSPPPASWASRAQSDVAIWTLDFQADARFTLPPVAAGTERSLYVYEGTHLTIGEQAVAAGHRAQLAHEGAVALQAGPTPTKLLLLQGRPIEEPVVKHGPFVMNTRAEIEQAYADYRTTQFGGWPWQASDPVHGSAPDRFARHADGRTERPT